MKYEAAEKYIHDILDFCQKNYCYKCPIRYLCFQTFSNNFVSQEFLNLALKCEKMYKELVERGLIND